MNLNKEEKHILLHTLGLSNIRWYDKDKIKNPYRNRFYTSENTTDYPIIKSLIDKDLMQDTGKGCGNNDQSNCRYFFATLKGIETAQRIVLESIPKLSRSKKRYQLYLHMEVDEPFINWLKNPYWDDCRKRNGV